MKARYKRVEELIESYLNGNKGYVRKEVKKINKAEFYFLVSGLLQSHLCINKDAEEIVYNLTLI